MITLRYLGGAFDFVDYVSKKIRVMRHTNQIILQEIDNFLKILSLDTLVDFLAPVALGVFLSVNFFSNVSKNIFVGCMTTLKVSRRCV